MLMNIEEALNKQGFFISTTAGISMYPMLRNRRDTIVVKHVNGRLNKYDIPLYNRGDEYILHRIIKVCPDSYVILGDNCIDKEYGITDGQILGVLTECYRDNKKVNLDGVLYRTYSRLWCAIFPIRLVYKKLKSVAKRLFRFLRRGISR